MPVKVKVLAPDAFRKLPEVEITIPDKCPHCGTDLTGENGLQETGWVFYCSHGCIEKADPAHGRTEDSLECDGSFEESFDAGTIHTAYMCNACDHVFEPKAPKKNAGKRRNRKAA
jgi:hypothetical protein